jgi:CDP-glycerol glycerophosphotransferase (TagB/SpsB family)
MSKIADSTPYFIQLLFGFLSFLTPFFVRQERNLVVLTSFHGDGYRGNTAVVYEALHGHAVLNAVWLSRNRTLVNDLKARYGVDSAELTHSFRGLRRLASAGFLMFTHGTSDFPFMFMPRRAQRIQTYHGLPTKCGEYMPAIGDASPGLFSRLILRYRFSPISWFVSSSPKVTELFTKRFNIPSHRFVETGYPSTDEIISGIRNPNFIHTYWPELALQEARIILYAPTFRRRNPTRWFPFDDYDLPVIAEFLEKHNVLMAIRPHPNEPISLEKYQKVSDRFINADHTVIENVNELLVHTDAIITDYSGIYLEGLLRDIPPIFLPYDLQYYERGIPLPYDEITPGPKVSSQVEFLKVIKMALDGTEDLGSEREKVRLLYFSRFDAKSTERLIGFLENLQTIRQS